MKLAELLRHRSGLQNRADELLTRLFNNVKSFDGEAPSEPPLSLLAALDAVYDELASVVATINHINASRTNNDGDSLSALLIRRETISRKLTVRKKAALKAVQRDFHEGGRSVRNIDVGALHAEAENLSDELRRVDAEIQQLNWSIEVVT